MASTTRDTRPVLIAYDGSSHADDAVREAARLFPGRKAVIVTAWRSVESAVSASLIAVPAGVAKEAQLKMDADSENEALGRAETAVVKARELGLEAEAQAILAGNSIARAVRIAADDHDAAVIVVGSRGLGGFKAALLGSTSNSLAHRSNRPVLVVHDAAPMPDDDPDAVD